MSARASRRAVLAAIALADAPMPEAVRFGGAGADTIVLDFDLIADARPWLAIFGDVLGEPDEGNMPGRPEQQRPPYRYLTAYPRGTWCGWKLMVTASEDIASPDVQLDEAIREQLAAVAGETGPAAP